MMEGACSHKITNASESEACEFHLTNENQL